MSFVRTEAATQLYRWRETITGVALVAFGLWWAFSVNGMIAWIGWVLAVAGLAFALAGIQRARFRLPGRGPGIVQITEGQITYFGPLTGGAVARSELTRISLDPSGKPAHWVLAQPGQPNLSIPITAEGADALFDVFESLPGLKTEFMLAQLKRTTGAPVVVWDRSNDKALRIAQG